MAGRTTKKTENVEVAVNATEAEVTGQQDIQEKKNTTRKTKEAAPEEKETAAKSKTTTKKASTEKTTRKRTTTKKTETAEPKEPKRKTTTKKVDKNVVFEFHGVQTKINVEGYENKVKDIWLNDWNRLAKDLNSIDLYIKPEDGKVYFVINGAEHGAIDM